MPGKLLSCFALVLLSTGLCAGERPADIPQWYWNGHVTRLAIAQKGGVELLFLGDSITEFWRREGSAVWKKDIAPYKAANFGVAGDTTDNVLWRVRNGELEGIHPRLVVLMIGTNDRVAPPETVERIKLIIAEIQQRSQGTRILLLGTFPAKEPGSKHRVKTEKINELLPGLASETETKKVVYLDIGSRFIDTAGVISPDVMPDLLHPSPKGYEIWGDAIREVVAKLMK